VAEPCCPSAAPSAPPEAEESSPCPSADPGDEELPALPDIEPLDPAEPADPADEELPALPDIEPLAPAEPAELLPLAVPDDCDGLPAEGVPPELLGLVRGDDPQPATNNPDINAVIAIIRMSVRFNCHSFRADATAAPQGRFSQVIHYYKP